MTSHEALSAIEGRRFAALTNLASNLKTFLRIAAQQSEVEVVSRAMAHEPAVITEVWQRALALAAVPADVEEESEGDAALATYLWLLSNHRRDLALAVASRLGEARLFFWANRLAGSLRAADGSANGSGGEAAEGRAGVATEEGDALYRKP
jgi:hypothetical protein